MLGASLAAPQGGGFGVWSGCELRLQIQSPVGGVGEATDGCFSPTSISLSLPPSPIHKHVTRCRLRQRLNTDRPPRCFTSPVQVGITAGDWAQDRGYVSAMFCRSCSLVCPSVRTDAAVGVAGMPPGGRGNAPWGWVRATEVKVRPSLHCPEHL